MDAKFLENHENRPFTWFRYIDNIFVIWTRGGEKLKIFLENLNQFNLNVKFKDQANEESIFRLFVKFSQGKLRTDFHMKPSDRQQYIHYFFLFFNGQLLSVKR